MHNHTYDLNVCLGVCGKSNSERVYELNRLWMSDKCPKNSESRFIGWALRQLNGYCTNGYKSRHYFTFKLKV